MEKLDCDIAIVGAGIAGLWLFHRLRSQGYSAIIIEDQAIGGTQTIASQGMIHGGQRYNLQGKVTAHGSDISAMPGRWAASFSGDGDVDLRRVTVLAENQFMWSPGGLTAGVTAFMASKAMNSRVTALAVDDMPEVFRLAPRFRGQVYRMDEKVVDVKSLVNTLVAEYSNDLYRARVVSVESLGAKGVRLSVADGENRSVITCRYGIFAAGIGNELAIRDLKLDAKGPRTQRRPLKQVMVAGVPHPLYAHCITTDPRPRVTVTAHPMADGSFVWYLGGIVAEYGLNKSDQVAIDYAKKEMRELFPWIDWSLSQWACYDVDRAEPYFDRSFFKSGPEILTRDRIAIVWPTKLTFAPAAADLVESWLKEGGLEDCRSARTPLPFAKPDVSHYPWETARWQS